MIAQIPRAAKRRRSRSLTHRRYRFGRVDRGPNLDASLEAVENTNMEGEEVGRGIEFVDDFIRNFCIRHGMLATLDAFEAEWIDLRDRNDPSEEQRRNIPDQYLMNLVRRRLKKSQSHDAGVVFRGGDRSSAGGIAHSKSACRFRKEQCSQTTERTRRAPAAL